jgi:pimeloyl-ACP methyl ester carboxylesterase
MARVEVEHRQVKIVEGKIELEGDLAMPLDPTGLVIFAHGSGSSRHSPRNRAVAGQLNQASLATLLMDLLTSEEEAVDQYNAALRFDIDLLAMRVSMARQWASEQDDWLSELPVGYFGASTGAAAALVAAAQRPQGVRAVVSRGGRPDLAGAYLSEVQAPTLLIVGGEDRAVIQMNREASGMMQCPNELVIVPGATHLFEEPGALEQVASHAADWFARNMPARRAAG